MSISFHYTKNLALVMSFGAILGCCWYFQSSVKEWDRKCCLCGYFLYMVSSLFRSEATISATVFNGECVVVLHPLFSCQINEDVHLVILQQAKRCTEVMAFLYRPIIVDQSKLGPGGQKKSFKFMSRRDVVLFCCCAGRRGCMRMR